MKKKLLIALLAGLVAVAAPVSCFAAEAADTTEEAQEITDEDGAEAEESASEESADEESDEKETASDKKEELKTVGEKKDGCITFKMKNATSKKITGLAIKTAEEADYPENMMTADDSFDLKEKKKVFFSKSENTAEETAEEVDPSQKMYDLHITFEDQTTADVHNIALEDLGTLTIREKDGITYGTYKTKSTKEKKNTYSAEKAAADQAAADAAAAQVASQPVESYDSSNDYSYDYSDDSSYDDSSDYSYDNSGDDGGDGCLDDGLLN
ncbi:hypothetical protein ACTQWG_02470 [Blautia sp. HCP3S3_H10_1]|uniref:hypothetical protein n=1 Tax=unclassified Blautia TaxID=2648079 RepID=UPI003F8F83FA